MILELEQYFKDKTESWSKIPKSTEDAQLYYLALLPGDQDFNMVWEKVYGGNTKLQQDFYKTDDGRFSSGRKIRAGARCTKEKYSWSKIYTGNIDLDQDLEK